MSQDHTHHNGTSDARLSAGSTARHESTARMTDIGSMEKDIGTTHHADSIHAMRQMHRTDSIPISPELFEKLYLSPANQVKGDLRKDFCQSDSSVSFLL